MRTAHALAIHRRAILIPGNREKQGERRGSAHPDSKEYIYVISVSMTLLMHDKRKISGGEQGLISRLSGRYQVANRQNDRYR
jgi:hypothetical protein